MARRTTVTLDDDVIARLDSEVRKRRESFKTVLNDALRRGLNPPAAPRKPFRIRSRNLGTRPGLDYDNVEALLDQVEGPFRK